MVVQYIQINVWHKLICQWPMLLEYAMKMQKEIVLFPEEC